jgi:hypothetical protein
LKTPRITSSAVATLRNTPRDDEGVRHPEMRHTPRYTLTEEREHRAATITARKREDREVLESHPILEGRR